MLLPLIDSQGDFRLLRSEEILYLQTDSSGALRFYSYDDNYKAVKFLKDWSHILRNEGFVRLDRGSLVNLSKISSHDSELRLVTIPTLQGEESIPYTEHVYRKLKQELDMRFKR